MGTDGRTDMTKLIVAFRNFAKAQKKLRIFPTGYIYSRLCAFRAILTVSSVNPLVCD